MSKMITRTFSSAKVTIVDVATGKVLEEDYKVKNLPSDDEKAKAKAGRQYALESKSFGFDVKIEREEKLLGITEEDFLKYAEPVVRPKSQQKEAKESKK